MAQEASMKDVGMYLMGTLQLMFEMADDAMSKYSVSYDDVKFEDRLEDVGGLSFVERSRGEDGHINKDILERNVGMVITCGAYMKDRVIAELDRNRVSRVQTEECINRNGHLTNLCHFVIDARDKELAREIVEKLNTRESIMRTDAKAFAIRCNEQNISISSVDMEQEKLDYMEKRGDLRVPYCSVPLENNNCRLYFETANADKVMSELKYATLILSASARANIMERDESWGKQIENVIAKLGDTHASCVVYDAYAPDHYVTSDSKGIHLHIGKQEELISRMDQGWDDRLYEILRGYGKINLVDDLTKNREAGKPENFKQEVPVLDAEKRIEMYKRELVEHMEFRLDNMDLEQKAQAKDNQVRLDNSIWHAIQSGNSDLEMRLKSDRSDNMESLFGKRDVNTVDLADMRDSEFIHAFCMRALGYATLEDPVALQAMLEEADKDPVMIALAAEDRSVKVAFIQEIEESVEETRQIKYELEEAGPKDILIDLEKEQTITAVINDHEMEEER